MSDLPTTEQRNPASEALDTLSALEIVRLMNAEDAKVAPAVGREAEAIAQAIDVIADRLRVGGRLVYLGAGTSGRLGVLDASECPPTFNSPPEQVIGLIAGGREALTRAVEGAEDQAELAVADLSAVKFSAKDVLVGIATSGRTPYVMRGLEHARGLGAFTIAISCTDRSAVAGAADLAITPVVGPEVLSGSTRLKAGTATKLVLNMLTTGAMVRLGKTYGNLMVDLRATNNKLRARTARIVRHLTGLPEDATNDLLERAGGELKTAVVMHHRGIPADQARGALAEAGGQLRMAIEDATSRQSRSEQTVAADLLLAIDGGGTGTTCLLARRGTSGQLMILGRGQAGPSNPHAIGFGPALAAIERAMQEAFGAAGLKRVTVGAACVALAGAGREDDHDKLRGWAERLRLAAQFRPVHDALPVLAAATTKGPAIALIAGTGSLAFGRDATGRTARSGGWGYLFGDEGSAYAIALQALRAVAKARDGRGPATSLEKLLAFELQLTDPQQLVPVVYQPLDRSRLASLAECVTRSAEDGDDLALTIVRAAAIDLAEMVVAVGRELSLSQGGYALGLTGGVLLSSSMVRDELKHVLGDRQFAPSEVRLVEEPAVGALNLAAELLE